MAHGSPQLKDMIASSPITASNTIPASSPFYFDELL